MSKESPQTNQAIQFKLRIVPWLTDGCSIFLNNLMKWFPQSLGAPPTLLEFGGGNSTLYFLQKGIKVTTIEHSDEFISMLSGIANNLGFKTETVSSDQLSEERVISADLTIIKAERLEDTKGIIGKHNWTFIMDDGISRMKVLDDAVNLKPEPIIILDNVEHCANWGRLNRSSAKPDLIAVYRSVLRNPDWQQYIFEQPEGRGGRSQADSTGWEAPHRWASAILWSKNHPLAKHMVTNQGFPLVNQRGIDDEDVNTLSERCPFDWETMTWGKPPFPPELDLGLERSYD